MSFDVSATHNFEKSLKHLAKKYRSVKQDVGDLVSLLEKSPLQGDEIAPGIRKIRMAITSKGKGKSGGARVITFNILTAATEGKVFLLEIYDKSEFVTVDVASLFLMIKQLGLDFNSSADIIE
ncbi:MAG: addiction module toxin RelE [Muribaculaceae bacterium]|nr:addiction module toxin RelE [Muribaculaceae bacterium]